MATATDLLDPLTLMSDGGLVDASTAEGEVDDVADWGGALAAMNIEDTKASSQSELRQRPAHLGHITRRRGAYSAPR